MSPHQEALLMKTSLGAHCDDFFTSCRIFFKMDLSLERETTLHFFERVQREYPGMRNFRTRDGNNLILEEKEANSRESDPKRWLRLDPRSMRFGNFDPPGREEVRRFANFLLYQAPFHLTLSDLDFDRMEVVYSFDLEYAGNHDQLVAETFFADHPLGILFNSEECAHSIDCQPYFGIALSEACDLQAYMELKSRTSSYEVRTGEYEPQLLTVYLTVQKFWGFDERNEPINLIQAYHQLADAADDLTIQRIIPHVVNPLAMAIASRPG
jgi:hypothetical protein